MNFYEKLFSGGFLLIMLGCIVFRVESWPFSDWRVYSHRMQLKHVVFHEVRAKVKGKTVFPLDDNSLDLTVHRQFEQLNVEPPHVKINQLCEVVINDVLSYTPATEVKILKYQVNDDMSKKITELCFWSNAQGMQFETKSSTLQK
jgi:hypothetical protein